MRERDLRRRCRRLLTELDIRPPLDVSELCRRVGETRGKPIRLVPHAIPVPGPFGVWITTDAADYIHGPTIYVDGGMTLYPEFAHGG